MSVYGGWVVGVRTVAVALPLPFRFGRARAAAGAETARRQPAGYACPPAAAPPPQGPRPPLSCACAHCRNPAPLQQPVAELRHLGEALPGARGRGASCRCACELFWKNPPVDHTADSVATVYYANQGPPFTQTAGGVGHTVRPHFQLYSYSLRGSSKSSHLPNGPQNSPRAAGNIYAHQGPPFNPNSWQCGQHCEAALSAV